jgi:hypothetical protein
MIRRHPRLVFWTGVFLTLAVGVLGMALTAPNASVDYPSNSLPVEGSLTGH